MDLCLLVPDLIPPLCTEIANWSVSHKLRLLTSFSSIYNIFWLFHCPQLVQECLTLWRLNKLIYLIYLIKTKTDRNSPVRLFSCFVLQLHVSGLSVSYWSATVSFLIGQCETLILVFFFFSWKLSQVVKKLRQIQVRCIRHTRYL